MAGTTPQIEWYLARGGQQYGPLSEPEMRKFIDLGHLRPTDLVWSHGFRDWQPAKLVFPDVGTAGSSRSGRSRRK